MRQVESRKMFDRIDQELLISLVEKRPVLWDKTAEDYKDKHVTYETWRDVCTHLDASYDGMSSDVKKSYGKIVTKKWTNMRDSWVKYEKKKRELINSGLSPNSLKEYQYYKQMMFLKKIFLTRPEPFECTECPNDNEYHDHDEGSQSFSDTHSLHTLKHITPYDDVNTDFDHIDEASNQTEKAKYKRTSKPEKPEMIEVEVDPNKENMSNIDSPIMCKKSINNIESQMMSFFRSIAPTVATLSQVDTINFQLQVLGLVKRIIEKQKQTPVSNTWHKVQEEDPLVAPLAPTLAPGIVTATANLPENSNDSSSPLLGYFSRDGDKARCDFCDTTLPADNVALKQHLKKKHPKLFAENTSANEGDEDDAQNDDVHTETMYLEEEEEIHAPASTQKEKNHLKLKAIKRESIRKRISELQRKRLHSSTSEEEEFSPKKKRSKTQTDAKTDCEEEIIQFGKYVTHLLKTVPQSVCTKLQMDIINLIMTAKINAQEQSKLILDVQNLHSIDQSSLPGNSAVIVMRNSDATENSSEHVAANITVDVE